MRRVLETTAQRPSAVPRFRQMAHMVAFSLVLMMLCALLPPAPVFGEGPVTMQVRVGYDGRARVGLWTPVVVDVENTGPNLTAELVVTGDEGGVFRGPSSAYSSEYAVAAALPQGARKQFTIYAPLNMVGSDVTVRLVHDGTTLAEADGTYTAVADADVLVGVLAQNLNAVTALPAQGTLGQGRQWTPVSLDEESLPTLPQALRTFDLLLLGDLVTQQLRPEQLAALEDWVSQGGTLVISGGAEARRTLGGLPPSLLPFAVEGSAVLPAATALERWGGRALPSDRPLTVSTGKVTEARVLLAQDGQPLAVLGHRGEGRVLFLAFDPSLEPLAGWPGLAPLWRELLAHTAPALLMPANSQPGALGSVGAISANYPNIVSALTNLPALDLPSVRLLAGILAAYVLLVGPVNYMVLRRMRRRAWSWFTIPVLVALFSSGTFLLALKDKGSDVLTSTISILHLNPDSSRQRIESYVGVFAPSETSYRLAVPEGRLVSSLGSTEYGAVYRRGGPGGQNSAPVGIRVHPDSGAVDLVGMSMWSMRSIATEYGTTLPGGLETELRLEGGKLNATVRNTTGLRIQDSYLIAGVGYAEVGDLAPGESKPAEISQFGSWNPNSGTPPPVYQLYNIGMSQGSPTADDRERMRKQQVLQTILNPKLSGMLPEDDEPLLFFGWTDGLPPALTVEGQTASGASLTAVTAQVPLDFVGAYDLPAGLLRGYPIALEGGGGFQGMVGGFQFADGSLTLQFDVPFAAGDPLRALKASVPITGTLLASAPFEAALYNWKTASWEPAIVAADGAPSFNLGKGIPPGMPVPPPPIRGGMGTASSMAYPSGPGNTQAYAATPAGAPADYVGADGTVRLKITKVTRDPMYFGTVTLGLEGGSNG